MADTSNTVEQATILIVDDTPDNLTLMHGLLKDTYKVKVANSGERALKIADSDSPPDLVLLDIMMPEMDGFEVLRHLRANEKMRDIPVVFLTAKTEIEDEQHGLELGAVDYIAKPISPPIVLARVRNHLDLKRMRDFLKSKNDFLEEEVSKRTKEITAIQDVTILAMASLAETRDNETGGHIRRTQHYVKVLALHLQKHPKFAWFLTDENVDMLYKSAPLHDIGKVGVPDAVLLKPGKLTDEERKIMNTHAALGYEAIDTAEKRLGADVKFLSMAKEIALSHQEKWDGSGYPEGRAGEDIPISARLMALADVYDALTTKRVYKPAFSQEKTREIILEGRAKHFDGDIVDAFIEIEDQFQRIGDEFADD